MVSAGLRPLWRRLQPLQDANEVFERHAVRPQCGGRIVVRLALEVPRLLRLYQQRRRRGHDAADVADYQAMNAVTAELCSR